MQNFAVPIPSNYLEDLRRSHQNYAPFLEEWLSYKFSGLTEIDGYVIRNQVKNQFIARPKFSKLIYDHSEAIKGANKRLQDRYPDFKDWLAQVFQHKLVRLVKRTDLERFCQTPIAELTIDEELKEALLDFRCVTIKHLLNAHTDSSFTEKASFEIVVRFLKRYKEIKGGFGRKVHKPYRKISNRKRKKAA